MSGDTVLVLAWLLLAHLVADFVLQTDGMVHDKNSPTRAWRGLLRHGAAVALCHSPAAAVWGWRGAALVAVVTLAHVAIDRWKVRATRRAEARALAGAHRRREGGDADRSADGLGPAWTPKPAALFLVDQGLHVAVTGVAWAVLIGRLGPQPEWLTLVAPLAGRFDTTVLHGWVLGAVVMTSLAIVNVRAGALFVATLVRPRDVVSGVSDGAVPARAGRGHAVPDPAPTPATPTAWRFRLGPLEATAEPRPADIASAVGASGAEVPPTSRAASGPADGHASPARIGATIGVLERLLIVTFVLTGSTAAIGFVVAAKTLARFKQLDDRDFAEYYLLGTLASVAVALGSALVAQAALATLP